MRWIIIAPAEAALTGLVLIVSPSLFAWLILGAQLTAPGEALGRIAGVAMLALGLACWPENAMIKPAAGAIWALLAYNVLATIYLCYLGTEGSFVGPLLWPAVALHIGLAVIVARFVR